MEKKSQKLYITDYNFLTMQDLWKAHYQILLIVLQKILMKLNANTDMEIKITKSVELNAKISKVFLNMQTLKMIQQKINVL